MDLSNLRVDKSIPILIRKAGKGRPMERKTTPIFFLVPFVLFWAVIMVGEGPSRAREPGQPGNLYQILKDDMGFSKKEFKKIKEGKVVTKRLDTSVKQELALFSIARINVPGAFFIENYGRDGINIETVSAEVKGTFSNSPEMVDVRAFNMPARDLKELTRCRLRQCKVKATAELIKKFGQLDNSSPDFEDRANTIIRRSLVEYIQKYLEDGNEALVVYNDKKNPVRLAEEFQDLLKGSSYLFRYVPELYTYLNAFPNGQLNNGEDVFYWMKENLGGRAERPVMSMNHLVFYRPPDTGGEAIVASKQLYATHYFEAALGLTVMVDDPERRGPGFYLMHINRSRIDILREIPRFLARTLFMGAHKRLKKKMTTVKKNVEEAYRASRLMADGRF